MAGPNQPCQHKNPYPLGIATLTHTLAFYQHMHMAFRYTSYYEVDASGNGTLPCGTPISTYTVQDHFPPLDLSHPNLLHIFFTNYAKNEVVCARKGESFNEWLEVFPSPFNSYIVFGDEEELPVSGQKKGLSVSNPISDSGKEVQNEVKAFSLSPKFRKLIGGMIQCVCYVHKKGYAMKELSEENICIVDGELRFWRLNFVQTSMELENQNFRSIADIISTILAHPTNVGYEWPPDVRNLLKLLKSDSAARCKKKIMRHMAMISPEMRLMLVDEMFQMGRYKKTACSWRGAADLFFVSAKLNDWRVKYEKKIIGHVLKCYDFRDASTPYITKLDESGGVKKFDVVDSFLNFLRNIAHHVGHDKKKGRRFSKEAIDAILFWAFGDEIMLFVECLDQYHLASYFWSDKGEVML